MNTNNVMKAIAELDLEPVKTKLMHVASGEGWSRAKVDAMDVEYRRFLYLMHAFPHEEVAPTVDVDTFWHYHILDTAKYALDCENTFGYFLHHYPYVGLDTDADEGELRGADRMRDLYEQTFGEAYIRAEVYGADAVQAFCMIRPGAQAAFCMIRPGEKKAEGAQAAFCMIRPGDQKAEGAQAAFCMIRPGEKKAAGAQAAFCMIRPGAKKTAIAQAAFCMIRPGVEQAPIRPALALAA